MKNKTFNMPEQYKKKERWQRSTGQQENIMITNDT
jgi:hypothetical protein